nr:MAG TPA: hypothetical protein [Caudoviricetes sp.]
MTRTKHLTCDIMIRVRCFFIKEQINEIDKTMDCCAFCNRNKNVHNIHHARHDRNYVV